MALAYDPMMHIYDHVLLFELLRMQFLVGLIGEMKTGGRVMVWTNDFRDMCYISCFP